MKALPTGNALTEMMRGEVLHGVTAGFPFARSVGTFSTEDIARFLDAATDDPTVVENEAELVRAITEDTAHQVFHEVLYVCAGGSG